MAPSLPSGTVTLLFTDIEGSSHLWDTARAAMVEALRIHNSLLRDLIAAHGGSIVKDKGDGFFAAFATPLGAVEAALAAQRALRDTSWPEEIGAISVRMAIHTGALEPEDGDYHGPVVNRVARTEGLAHGGQVLVSDATRTLVYDTLSNGVGLRDLGPARLKGLSEAEHVFQLEAPDLPHDFPPLRSGIAAGVPLPEFLTSFVGRQQERDEISALLDAPDGRLVTLLGPGGIGKTRLAVETARQMADGFSGGAFFADLAPVATADGVGAALAESVGAHPEGTAPIVSLAASRIAAPTLLVIDNFEHVLTAAATVGDFLAAAPAVRILVTSRTPLQLRTERLFRVEPLGATSGNGRAAPAVELFYDRAARAGVTLAQTGRDADAAASICRRVDGLPLAIELVAARTRLLDVSELDAMLGRSLDALGSGASDLPERHRTIRATVDWSLQALTPSQRSLFNRLAVLPGGATLDQLGWVAAMDPAGVLLDELSALVDNSLVTVARGLPGGTRYGQLVPLREYGLELLAGEDEHDPAMNRLVDYYVAIAPALGRRLESDQSADAELATDAPNMTAAMRWSIDHGRFADVADFTMRFWEYWFHGDRLAPLAEWLAAADQHLDGPVIDWLAGFLGFQQGDYATAGERMARARAGFAATGETDRAALTDTFLGALTDDLEAGRNLLEAARDHFRAHDGGLSWFLAVMFLSFNHVQRGEHDAATAVRRDLLEWSERVGYGEMEGWARLNLAIVLIATGRLDEADLHSRTCLNYMVDAGFQEGIASAAEALAYSASRRGDLPRGLRLLGGADAVYARLAVGRWPEAEILFEDTTGQARTELGNADVDRLLDDGRALTVDQLAQLALEN
jgi:predicted ATPase/class 3 adenylate cyclase